ncbi:Asp23/Gls24 family envelope stress response protein [Alkalibaculum sp. M08DMB]|uniref:Asp23/Gls24 family envelope stress response protein n=1 Tax=Alkalibaculum sporogenes TaxID=2655001 RepID=A0A6A7K6N7_9FIRM|nr:Asp23/Gls24 family envelope stress response protein [Alkalibaculum sporogenes]MPW25159.1 Asp23/Gls24 family envelope stress response protein [Alkalibaculum sporogenes]
MANQSEKELGKIDISEDVIGSIASLATLEVDGVVEMVGGLTKDIAEKLGKKNQAKGVKITRNNNELVVDIYLIVKYGVQIQDTGYNVQKKVKHSIEIMTGLNVVQINVNVEGVQLKVAQC